MTSGGGLQLRQPSGLSLSSWACTSTRAAKSVFPFAAGVKGGAEKLYHILCLLPYGLDVDLCEDDPQATMTINISNAFNELSRPLIFDILDGKASQDYAGGRIRKVPAFSREMSVIPRFSAHVSTTFCAPFSPTLHSPG